MDKHEIINRKLRGESFRKISVETGIHRSVVTKIWNEYLSQHEKLEGVSNQNDIVKIQEEISKQPQYNSSNRKKRKLTDAIINDVKEILIAEEKKDKKLGNHKQRLTKLQIYEIISKKHDISYTTICNLVGELKATIKELFIRQEYDFGDRIEFDFGECKLIVNGELTLLYMAVFTAPASNFRWCYIYDNSRKEVFLDAHIRFFEMIGGIFREVVYDNMKNVVSKFIGRHEKELNPDLIKLALYYGFIINTTNCFSGNEKGSVERAVEVLRNKLFAVKYEFVDMKEVYIYTENDLLELSKNSLIEEEKKHLLPMKPKYEISNITQCEVNKYGVIAVEKNFYSVPEYLVGRKVTVKIYHDKIFVYSNNEEICFHNKKSGIGEYSINILHHLKTLKKKPGAIRNSLALKSVPELKTIYDLYYSSNPKCFIEIMDNHKNRPMCEIIKELKKEVNYKDPKVKIVNNVNGLTKKQIDLYNKIIMKG